MRMAGYRVVAEVRSYPINTDGFILIPRGALECRLTVGVGCWGFGVRVYHTHSVESV